MDILSLFKCLLRKDVMSVSYENDYTTMLLSFFEELYYPTNWFWCFSTESSGRVNPLLQTRYLIVYIIDYSQCPREQIKGDYETRN